MTRSVGLALVVGLAGGWIMARPCVAEEWPSAAALTLVSSAGTTDFRKGMVDLELTGGYVFGYRKPHDRLGEGTVALGYYIADDLALSIAGSGYYVRQPDGPTAGAGGVDLMGRWHFLTLDRFSAYVDGGAGAFYAGHEVPAGGTHFDFNLKAGLGATFRLDRNLFLIGGARYWHLSNGGIHGRERNPGIDGVEYYGGLLFAL